MAIRITEDGKVIYENEPDIDRELFPNLHCESGKSAYDQAVEGGYTGSEEDFIRDLNSISTKAPAIYDRAVGAIASFSDGADDMPIKSCVVSIEPIQEGEGDPSPENVRPISGRTGLSVTRVGKNLFPYSVIEAYTYAWYDGSKELADAVYPVFISGGKKYVMQWTNANTDAKPLIRAWRDSGELLVNLPNVLNARMLNSNIIFSYQSTPCYYNSSITSSENACLIEPTEDLWVDIRAQSGKGTLDSVQLELNSRATDYEPYKGETYSVNLETEAGTVYGGTLDIVSGKLIVDRGYIASYNGETLPSTWISDRDVYSAGTTPTIGAQVVYKLATPTEIQLTSQEVRTLLGENNIWSDAGSMAVEYPADTKLYIQGLTGSDEVDMVSNTNIPDSTYFIINNTLYKSTAAIASGDTIVPGTNCTVTNIAEALNALNTTT